MDLNDRTIPEHDRDPDHALPSGGAAARAIRETPTRADAERRKKAVLDLFLRWDEEDRTNDPAELERRRDALEDFKRGMNENDSSGRRVFP